MAMNGSVARSFYGFFLYIVSAVVLGTNFIIIEALIAAYSTFNTVVLFVAEESITFGC